MLTSTVYDSGYIGGTCMSFFYNIICCYGCSGSSSFNIGQGIYDLCGGLCCNWTCDYEYCLLYCAGCYDGVHRNSDLQVPENTT